MSNDLILSILLLSIFTSIAVNGILRGIAKKNKILIDLPDRSRKFHQRPTPLTGGLGIFVSIMLSTKIYIDLNNLNDYVPIFSESIIYTSLLLLIFFLYDDFKHIRYLYRLAFQALASLVIIFITGVQITNFGNLLGFGGYELGIFSVPITVFCVVGVMNAFNMIDGINGLCAGFALLMLLFSGFYSGFIYDSLLIFVIGSILGFLVYNLRIIGKKRAVFLGDSGSNILGFIVGWVAIYCSQNQLYDVNAITMVWFIAIPLLDCIGLIISRTLRNISWAAPGRDHIHHKLMLKFSPENSLLILILFSSLISIFAIYLQENFNESLSFYLFALFALSYYLIFHFYIKPKTSNETI
tara:strand:- start:1506 stop:2567 length:1062 start_codon:yes stop_codon:yes gene_type:complete